ncbi:MAG TPA: 30S ribosomal protein S6 [Candidatus Dormibacteraeota bacterium]|nr:30S ribosomal protein S6 [Candidatus Dormibacteraeota bacterium]
MEREYELMYIVRPDLDDEQVRVAMDEVTTMVANHGGEITKQSLWGRRRLAYTIAGSHDGYYVLAEARLPGDGIGEIERQLRLAENVIRHLITTAQVIQEPEEPSVRGRERWRARGTRARARGAAGAAPDEAGEAAPLGEAAATEPPVSTDGEEEPVSAVDAPAITEPEEA